MFSVDAVSFCADSKVLLRDISCSLQKGRLYGLIGHNGSGKSTFIRLLSGELAPSSGAVYLQGERVHALSPKARARRIAYLPQKLPEAADFLVRELVMLGRFPWQGWLQKPSAEDVSIVEQAMQQTAVAPFAEQPVNTLSGGERQRVWLVMCLAQQSACLLLDEPLAALDIVYQVEVLQLVRRLVDERGLTVVLIIHDMQRRAHARTARAHDHDIELAPWQVLHHCCHVVYSLHRTCSAQPVQATSQTIAPICRMKRSQMGFT